MLRDGYLDQVVRRARRLYAERRNYTCSVLAQYGRIIGQDAGLHITLLMEESVDDRVVAARARSAGVVVAPLSDYRRTTPGRPGLVIGYATPSDAELHHALHLLAGVLKTRSDHNG
jgi:GntR family transcriptional regulator/MocR family aminotransferase